MKYVLAAIALTIAFPAAAQVNPAVDPHAAHTGSAAPATNADHAGHGQADGNGAAHDMHAMHKKGTANAGSATEDAKPGCCPDDKKMSCCEKMPAQGKKMDCCAGAKASQSSDEHADH